MKSLSKNQLIKFLILILFVLAPFSISDYSDDVIPEKITSDLDFYEINTCSISLIEFLVHNKNVIYQDHYKIKFNNYSSIGCFGQITGVDQINNNFYISIGTNTLLNIFLQAINWLLVLSFFPQKKIASSLSISEFFSLSFISCMLCILIYSEKRYYDNSIFFELDLQQRRSYIYIFIYLYCISYILKILLDSRSDQIINYIPFLYLFFGVISGLNFYFLFIYFSYFGLSRILSTKKLRKNLYLLNFLIFYWSYNAVGLNFYLKPDKIRGLSHSDYNYLSVYVWSYLIIFTLIGLYYFFKEKLNYLDISILKNNYITSSVFLIIFGYLGSTFPFVNFMNYYFFGQPKYGTDNSNLFSTNYWGESEAWRGFFPSAETIGEFYALTILLIIIFTKKFNVTSYIGIAFSLLGLFAANNKAAIVAMFFCLYLNSNFKNNMNSKIKILFSLIPLFLLLYFIRLENFSYSYEFIATKMIDMGTIYSSLGEFSSSIVYLSNDTDKNILISGFISILSAFAFLINRSELWGLFFARYNPSLDEFLFGTGPYILSNHYGEVNISSIRISTGTDLGFLLPHSSFLLLLVYFGILGVLLITTCSIIVLLKVRKINYDFFIIGIFILLNLIKSDSILYLPTLINYFLFFIVILKRKKLTYPHPIN
tara:strand:- start:651 stop:2609 length:1959 start_codon:yes stop_codon:yes gene_type:complete